jgi:predicted aconitase with swiveling domain
MRTTELKGRGVAKGIREGEALVSPGAMVWSHGIDPATGVIVDKGNPLYGLCVREKVFFYPQGKGSTASTYWLLETIRCGHSPAAILNHETEIIIASGALLGRLLYGKVLPIVDRLEPDPLVVIETGDWVEVDGNSGVVRVTKGKKP